MLARVDNVVVEIVTVELDAPVPLMEMP